MPSLPASSGFRLIPIVFAQVTGLACGIAGVKLNSHLVPPAQLGLYGLFLTLAPIGMWVVHAGLMKFTSRHWAGSPRRAGLWREITGAWARRLPWLALAAGAGAAALARLIPGRILELWLALFTAAALLALAALAQAALQAERAHWRDCAVAASASLSRTFLPPLLFVATGGAVSALWFGYCGHTLVMAGAGIWALRRYWHNAPEETPPAPELTSVYQGPFFIALAIVGWSLTGLNRWLVAGFFGEVEAGYFTLAGSAAAIAPAMLGTMLLQYFQPGFFALGDGPAAARPALARQVDQVALAAAIAGLIGVAVMAAVAPWLVGPLISPAYRDALKWVLPAGCFSVATITAMFFNTMLLAGRRERACAPVDLSTAGVLATGCLAAAAAGPEWLGRWLLVTPLVPWLLSRTLARHYFFKPAADPASTPTL